MKTPCTRVHASDTEASDENADSDEDSIPNSVDNCPVHPNPDQADCDQDSLGDAPGTLIVSGSSRFTDGEVFGDASVHAEYVVMPTIHGSWLTGAGDGVENQQDLRPTAGP